MGEVKKEKDKEVVGKNVVEREVEEKKRMLVVDGEVR